MPKRKKAKPGKVCYDCKYLVLGRVAKGAYAMTCARTAVQRSPVLRACPKFKRKGHGLRVVADIADLKALVARKNKVVIKLTEEWDGEYNHSFCASEEWFNQPPKGKSCAWAYMDSQDCKGTGRVPTTPPTTFADEWQEARLRKVLGVDGIHVERFPSILDSLNELDSAVREMLEGN